MQGNSTLTKNPETSIISYFRSFNVWWGQSHSYLMLKRKGWVVQHVHTLGEINYFHTLNNEALYSRAYLEESCQLQSLKRSNQYSFFLPTVAGSFSWAKALKNPFTHPSRPETCKRKKRGALRAYPSPLWVDCVRAFVSWVTTASFTQLSAPCVFFRTSFKP